MLKYEAFIRVHLLRLFFATSTAQLPPCYYPAGKQADPRDHPMLRGKYNIFLLQNRQHMHGRQRLLRSRNGQHIHGQQLPRQMRLRNRKNPTGSASSTAPATTRRRTHGSATTPGSYGQHRPDTVPWDRTLQTLPAINRCEVSPQHDAFTAQGPPLASRPSCPSRQTHRNTPATPRLPSMYSPDRQTTLIVGVCVGVDVPFVLFLAGAAAMWFYLRSRSRSCSRQDSAEDGADAKLAAMGAAVLMVLVLVPSGGGRGFAYKVELPGNSGEEVHRGVEKAGKGAGSVGGRGRGSGRAGWSWGGAGLACAEPEGEAAR